MLPSGKVLIAGGNPGSGATSSVELYGPDTGSLEVTLNPPEAVSAGAQWQVDGGAFQNSGAIVNNLAPGDHTIAFKTVTGWLTPNNQSATVSTGTTNAVSGTYAPDIGSLKVILEPLCAALPARNGNWMAAPSWTAGQWSLISRAAITRFRLA
jgi:hypothetical protein